MGPRPRGIRWRGRARGGGDIAQGWSARWRGWSSILYILLAAAPSFCPRHRAQPKGGENCCANKMASPSPPQPPPSPFCANGPFQVLCLTNVSSGMAFWAVQEDADDADDADDGDWGR